MTEQKGELMKPLHNSETAATVGADRKFAIDYR